MWMILHISRTNGFLNAYAAQVVTLFRCFHVACQEVAERYLRQSITCTVLYFFRNGCLPANSNSKTCPIME